MGRREPCICCGQDPIEADLGNLCHACFEHFPRGHPASQSYVCVGVKEDG